MLQIKINLNGFIYTEGDRNCLWNCNHVGELVEFPKKDEFLVSLVRNLPQIKYFTLPDRCYYSLDVVEQVVLE